jgi:hypothetical protein
VRNMRHIVVIASPVGIPTLERRIEATVEGRFRR